MQGHHWAMLLLAVVVGYVVGIKFPSLGHSVGL